MMTLMQHRSIHRLLLGTACVVALGISGCSSASRPTSPATMPTALSSQAHPDTDAARQAHLKAMQLIGEKKYEDAEKLLTTALAADVAFGPAHNSLGVVYYHQSKYYAAAWEFQYAAKLMPYQSEPRNNLGLVFEHVGKLDEAVDWYQRASTMEPDNAVLIGNLARARYRRGDRDESVRDLLQSLLIKDTRSDWITWARERLALLKIPDRPTPPTEP
jgi:type IV pilus assembly protein PilF